MPKRGEEGYYTANKYNLLFPKIIHNMNVITERAH